MNTREIASLLSEYGDTFDRVLPRLLGVLGEAIVCAELKKHCIRAKLCRGQKRSIDLVTDTGRRIQVKTAQRPKFVTNLSQKNFYKEDEPHIWVLVLIGGARPRFFILTHREICKLQKAVNKASERRYFKRHGKPFKGRGVDNVRLAAVEQYEDKWSKVRKTAKLSGTVL